MCGLFHNTTGYTEIHLSQVVSRGRFSQLISFLPLSNTNYKNEDFDRSLGYPKTHREFSSVSNFQFETTQR